MKRTVVGANTIGHCNEDPRLQRLCVGSIDDVLEHSFQIHVIRRTKLEASNEVFGFVWKYIHREVFFDSMRNCNIQQLIPFNALPSQFIRLHVTRK